MVLFIDIYNCLGIEVNNEQATNPSSSYTELLQGGPMRLTFVYISAVKYKFNCITHTLIGVWTVVFRSLVFIQLQIILDISINGPKVWLLANYGLNMQP